MHGIGVMFILFKVTLIKHQAFVDAFVSSGLSQWVTESTFFRSGNILDFVFTSAIDRIGNVNIHCPFPHCGHCPIVFDYVSTFLMNFRKTVLNFRKQVLNFRKKVLKYWLSLP